MSTTEVGNGFVLPYAAIAIVGKGGAAGILLITFMAETSTLSAQVIAVSSGLSFDIYRTDFNKQALDRDVICWSHLLRCGLLRRLFRSFQYALALRGRGSWVDALHIRSL